MPVNIVTPDVVPGTGTQYQLTLASGISNIEIGDLNGDGRSRAPQLQ